MAIHSHLSIHHVIPRIVRLGALFFVVMPIALHAQSTGGYTVPSYGYSYYEPYSSYGSSYYVPNSNYGYSYYAPTQNYGYSYYAPQSYGDSYYEPSNYGYSYYDPQPNYGYSYYEPSNYGYSYYEPQSQGYSYYQPTQNYGYSYYEPSNYGYSYYDPQPNYGYSYYEPSNYGYSYYEPQSQGYSYYQPTQNYGYSYYEPIQDYGYSSYGSPSFGQGYSTYEPYGEPYGGYGSAMYQEYVYSIYELAADEQRAHSVMLASAGPYGGGGTGFGGYEFYEAYEEEYAAPAPAFVPTPSYSLPSGGGYEEYVYSEYYEEFPAPAYQPPPPSYGYEEYGYEEYGSVGGYDTYVGNISGGCVSGAFGFDDAFCFSPPAHQSTPLAYPYTQPYYSVGFPSYPIAHSVDVTRPVVVGKGVEVGYAVPIIQSASTYTTVSYQTQPQTFLQYREPPPVVAPAPVAAPATTTPNVSVTLNKIPYTGVSLPRVGEVLYYLALASALVGATYMLFIWRGGFIKLFLGPRPDIEEPAPKSHKELQEDFPRVARALKEKELRSLQDVMYIESDGRNAPKLIIKRGKPSQKRENVMGDK